MSEQKAAGKKSGGGFWSKVGKLLEGISVEVNVGPVQRKVAGDPTDPAARMQPVHQERKEVFDEIAFRTSGGAQGKAPMERIDRERQHVARSIDDRMSAQAAAAPIPTGGGEPLPKDVRARMEPTLGADLSSVRVHRSSASAAAAEGMNAKAFAVGQDVHLGSGQYAPDSKEGDRLLAHELTHTVQAQRSGVQRKAEHPAEAHAEQAGTNVSHPDEPAEKEADAVADHAAEQLHGDGGGSAAQETKPTAAAAPVIGAKLQHGTSSATNSSGR